MELVTAFYLSTLVTIVFKTRISRPHLISFRAGKRSYNWFLSSRLTDVTKYNDTDFFFKQFIEN
jgi:hypothetical protein